MERAHDGDEGKGGKRKKLHDWAQEERWNLGEDDGERNGAVDGIYVKRE